MGILGVVILARHGDREEFFQDPYSYETAHTTLTPLGEVWTKSPSFAVTYGHLTLLGTRSPTRVLPSFPIFEPRLAAIHQRN